MSRRVRVTVLLSVFALSIGAFAGVLEPEDAARGVLQRLIPDKADLFELVSIPKDNGRDVFEIETAEGGKIILRGSSGVAISSALNWYLRRYCNATVSLCGNQLDLADPLPPVGENVRIVSPFRYRYCFNYCAFSYSMAWWDWPQWERLIDWMALHGINMPLAVTGQEAVWQAVYRTLGLTEDEIGTFFVGPAYLPFGWMGCMDGWGGPLPQGWIDQHVELEKKILARERELGMTPVLQGFTGHVPPALKEKFPEAKFQQLPSWCGFPGTVFLDPLDPLFERVGKAFVEEQTRLYGTDHLYASDTFIEMSPPSNDPAFLSNMGGAVYNAMKAGDPEATWVMQGWIFVNNPRFWQPPQGKALLGAVPDDRMILLDLMCETSPVWKQTEAFYGKPWLWCIIQDFGNVVSLHGGLPQISEGLSNAVTSPQRGKLSGVGFLMEGLGYNPVVYDLLGEMIWSPEQPDLGQWISEYAHRRYGGTSRNADRAWQRLLETAYRVPGRTNSVICSRPTLSIPASRMRAGKPYEPTELARAWQFLLGCARELGDADTYRYDLVNVARQVLDNRARYLYRDIVTAYKKKDRESLASAGERFLGLLRDMDELLATREEFLLGRWLADANRWPTSGEEERLYEWNARNQITLWGPRDSVLHDYARKQWSGLTKSFYLPRWEMFLDDLDRSLADGEPFDAESFEQELRTWEEQWTHKSDPFPDQPEGDAVEVVRRLWTKYHKEIL